MDSFDVFCLLFYPSIFLATIITNKILKEDSIPVISFFIVLLSVAISNKILSSYPKYTSFGILISFLIFIIYISYKFLKPQSERCLKCGSKVIEEYALDPKFSSNGYTFPATSFLVKCQKCGYEEVIVK
uniref:Uncharacterized protein n=1 Tax=candidate division CPR3 bacterium TaxID=2268181 RepID=A0A7C4M2L0_UNCC3